MLRTMTLATIAAVALTTSLAAQAKGAKTVVNALTIKAADGTTYTGTMAMAIDKGKVTGTLHITTPTEIKGALAGTSEKGRVKLAFPYTMIERKCDGTAKMDLTIPSKAAPVTGTMEAVGCGRDETRKLTGTVELVPVKK